MRGALWGGVHAFHFRSYDFSVPKELLGFLV